MLDAHRDEAFMDAIDRKWVQLFGDAPSAAVIGSSAPDYNAGLAWDSRRVSISQIREMCYASGTGSMIQNAMLLASQGEWEVEPVGRVGKRDAKYVEELLRKAPADGGMRTPMRHTLKNLVYAIRDGFVVLEKVWKQEGGEWVLADMPVRPAESIQFRVDDHGHMTHAVQSVNGRGDVEIPRGKLVHLAFGAFDNPHYGRSAYEAAFRHWDAAVKLYVLVHAAFNRWVDPIKVVTYEASRSLATQRLEELEKIMKARGANQSFVLPDWASISVVESSRQFGDALPIVQHHISQMGMSVLVQFLALGAEGKSGGSYNLGDVHEGLFMRAVDGIRRDVALTINTQVIPEMLMYNRPGAHPVAFGFKPDDSYARDQISKMGAQLISQAEPAAKGPLIDELMRKVASDLGLEVDWAKAEQAPQVSTSPPSPSPGGEGGDTTDDDEPAPEDDQAQASDRQVPEMFGDVEVMPDGEQLHFETKQSAAKWKRTLDELGEEFFNNLVKITDRIGKSWVRQFDKHMRSKKVQAILKRVAPVQASESGEEVAQFVEMTPEVLQEIFENFGLSVSTADEKATLNMLVQGFNSGATATLEHLGIASGAFALRDRELLAAIADQVNLVKGASDTAFEAIRTHVQQGMTAGENPIDFARRIRGEFEDMTKGRSERIARTESQRTLRRANSATYEKSGVSGEEWSTTLGGEVRDEHREMHGEIRYFPEPFSNGDSFVGESSPYNCECTALAVIRRGDELSEWDGS